jgi:hypothetical protein
MTSRAIPPAAKGGSPRRLPPAAKVRFQRHPSETASVVGPESGLRGSFCAAGGNEAMEYDMNQRHATDPNPAETNFAPAAFAARTHPFRAVSFVTGLYLAVVVSAPWLIVDGPPVTPTPEIVASAYVNAAPPATRADR